MERRRLRVWDLSRLSGGVFLLTAAVVFALGLLMGFLLSGHFQGLAEDYTVWTLSSDSITLSRFGSVLWSHFRWLFFAALLSLSALGFFLLYPLLFLRGLLFGFSFSSLFDSNLRIPLLLHFFLTALLECSPMLMLATVGMVRSVAELRRPVQDRLFAGAAAPILLLLLSLLSSLLCTCVELWLMPGFASYI